MDTKLTFTRQKILSIVFIVFLLLFCFIIALRFKIIPGSPTPLSNAKIEAMFYIQNSESGSMTCIGDGLINSPQEVVCNDITTANAIITAPDYASYISKDLTVVWETIRNSADGYQVIGEVASIANRKSKRSVTDYGAKGDGVTDDSNAIIQCMAENDVVVFPAGTYHVTKQLVIPNGRTLMGLDGAIIDFHNNTTKGYNYGYLVNENSSWMPSKTLAHDITISNLTVKKSNLTTEAKSIILFTNVTNVTMDHVTVLTAYNDYVNTVNLLINCHKFSINNCTFENNQYTKAGGFWIQDRAYQGVAYGTDNITVTKCTFIRNHGIDEVIGVYTPSNSSGARGYVSDVIFDDCTIIRNYNNTEGTRAPYLITATIGHTRNIKFKNCTIEDKNAMVGVLKLLVDDPNNINPIEISNCNITAMQSYHQNGTIMLFPENNVNRDNIAIISDSNIYAGSKVVCCASGSNFKNCNFYLYNNAVALDSNNIADNCHFYFTDCTSSGRMIRNNKAVLNNSTITVLSGTANKYVIQPKEANNLTINSDVPILIQK